MKATMKGMLLVWALGAAMTAAAGCDEQGARVVEVEGEMPELFVERTQDVMAFEDPRDCARCHANHVAEWEMSNHAYAAKDPVFHAMVRVGQAQTEGKLGQFCVQCHTPTGMATGQTPVVFDQGLDRFRQVLDTLDPVAQQGVSCDVCHSVTDVIEPVNARMVLTPNGIKRGTIADPVATPAHDSAYSALHGESDLCGSCHAVTNPRQALIEETFPEWEASQAARDGKTCQSCHMPEYLGQAAPDAPERTLHRHTFVGVDVSLLPEEEFPGYQEMRDLAAAMLRSSAKMSAEASGRRLDVSVENLAGHALPSGATAERQMWLEVLVRDADGELVFESGTLDARGDLRDGLAEHSLAPGSDPQLAYWGQLLIQVPGLDAAETDAQRQALIDVAEAACRPMGLGGVDPESGILPVELPWQANWQCNYMIRPDQTDERSFDLGALAPGTYTASVRLRFRTFPPHFLRKLEELGGLDPDVKGRVPTVLIAEEEVTLTVQRGPEGP